MFLGMQICCLIVLAAQLDNQGLFKVSLVTKILQCVGMTTTEGGIRGG